MRSWIALVIAIGISVPGLAHEDRRFDIKEDGRVVGIPEPYGPVRLLREGTPDAPDVAVVFPTRTLELPPCIARLFFLLDGESVRASGSWYHDTAVLPVYLNVELPQATKAPGFFSGHSLWFDLENPSILEFKQHIADNDGRSMVVNSLPSQDPCEAEDPLKLRPPAKDGSVFTKRRLR